MHRVHESARVTVSPKRSRSSVAILSKETPKLFIQDDHEGDGVRAELHGRGAERVGGLQRMPALHAPVTLPTLADRHAKRWTTGRCTGRSS